MEESWGKTKERKGRDKLKGYTMIQWQGKKVGKGAYNKRDRRRH